MKALILAAAAVFLIAGPVYADPGRGGEGSGGGKLNANKEINAGAKFNKDLIKNIETEDDYWGAVDSVAHFGVGGLELESQGYNVNWDHLDKKWDKSWDRLNREYEKLNR